MVEIRYGENSEQADLAGNSVAEVREQCKSEFNIPDKAKARLNDKEVKKRLEPEAILNDDDKLSFAEKSRKGLVLLGAFLLALAVTGGSFAYAALTQTVLGVVTPKPDFADVAVGADAPTFTVFGAFSGKVPAATQMFKITPADTFTGDFVVQLYLTNVDDLTEVYRTLGLRFSVQKGTFASVTTTPSEAFLSLRAPVTEIEVKNYVTADGTKALNVKLEGGFYRAHWYGGWPSNAEDPIILCQVIQKGAP